jgi:hypothetical protein
LTLFAVVLFTLLVLPPIILFFWCSDHLFVLRIKQAWFFKDHVLVRMLDHENKITHTLARASHVYPNAWEAPVYFGTNVGHVILMPGGVVHPESDCYYMYAWQHMDEDLRVQDCLAYDDHPTWESWLAWNHREKMVSRRKLVYG